MVFFIMHGLLKSEFLSFRSHQIGCSHCQVLLSEALTEEKGTKTNMARIKSGADGQLCKAEESLPTPHGHSPGLADAPFCSYSSLKDQSWKEGESFISEQPSPRVVPGTHLSQDSFPTKKGSPVPHKTKQPSANRRVPAPPRFGAVVSRCNAGLPCR